ncbi:hypothetical protein BX600DRAFT_58587 [Xylariales sp. PMI_506]|nr:hypothetical protein BX600DRAFT_58587 [Xylariales sp. PMI_506]
MHDIFLAVSNPMVSPAIPLRHRTIIFTKSTRSGSISCLVQVSFSSAGLFAINGDTAVIAAQA